MREACWYEKIYVVQKPIKAGHKKGGYDVMLNIDYKGKNTIEGNQTYQQNSKELEDKIEEAYQYAYKRFILGK
tara:strand:+ start:4385 stop:4603 length:219 start_codon:yes stop_codon:yes gene_type:complete